MNNIDLNLIKVFDAVMREQSTTRAAAKIGLSQPAVSAAIKRFGYVVDHDLFVRIGPRLVPTEFALELHPKISAILSDLEESLTATKFEPKKSTAHFSIVASDYFSTTLMPVMVEHLAKSAPDVSMSHHDWPEEALHPSMGLQKHDLAFDGLEETVDWVQSEQIFETHGVPMVRRNHPMMKERGLSPGDVLSLDLLAELTHSTYLIDGLRPDGLDPRFEATGLRRKTAVSFQHFFSQMAAVTNTDYVCVVPREYAIRFGDFFKLEGYSLPWDQNRGQVLMYWHKSTDGSPKHRWFRQVVRDCVASMLPREPKG